MLLRMQSCMIIAFKKVIRFGYHDKPSLPGGQVDGLGLGTANHRMFMLTPQ